jgi:hypothetical protein
MDALTLTDNLLSWRIKQRKQGSCLIHGLNFSIPTSFLCAGFELLIIELISLLSVSVFMAQNIFLAFSNLVGTTDYDAFLSLQVDCGFNK